MGLLLTAAHVHGLQSIPKGWISKLAVLVRYSNLAVHAVFLTARAVVSSFADSLYTNLTASGPEPLALLFHKLIFLAFLAE
jgi:hypothetical protein